MIKRFVFFIIVSVMAILFSVTFFESTRNSTLILLACFIALILYALIEMVWSFVNNGNYFIISGLVIMIITIITFVMGFWEKGEINKSFIVAVAVLATFFTIKDFIGIADFSEKIKARIDAFLFICTISSICLILMVSPNVIKINDLNTDYLAFISLGIAISNIGLNQQKKEKSKNT